MSDKSYSLFNGNILLIEEQENKSPSPILHRYVSPESGEKVTGFGEKVEIQLPLPLTSSEPSEEKRPKWDSQWEFLFSCISMSVGLGNVWRFPVTLYRNGGGAFLIPYFIVLVLIGRPIYFLELCLGQFSSRNQVEAWRCVPLFKGVGLGTMVVAMCLLTYYCSILALPVYYFVASCANPLPWTECKESWAGLGRCNGSSLVSGFNKSLPELYFMNEVLKESADIEDGIGVPDGRLVGCLIFAWVIVFLTIMRGAKSSGKVAYLTAVLPYAVLLVLLIRALTLPGAKDGVIHFLSPDWSKLSEPYVYYEAATQCFFSLSTGLGSIIMFASYLPMHYNVYRASFLFTFMDTFTSLLTGVITFAILGNLSNEYGMSIESFFGEGDISLAFVSYPNAIDKIGWAPQLFACLFFSMLFTLGLGSATSMAAAISAIFCDRYSHFREWVVTLVICICGCLLGLIYVTPGGQFILHLVDFFGVSFLLFSMCTFEVIGVAWCYGLYNFLDDMEFMLGFRLGIYWKLCWGVFSPISLMFMFVYALVKEKLEYNGVPYPANAKACGWLLASTAFICLVIGGIDAMKKVSAKSWNDKFLMALKPRYDWGPRDPKDREEWQLFLAGKDRRTFLQRLKSRSGI